MTFHATGTTPVKMEVPVMEQRSTISVPVLRATQEVTVKVSNVANSALTPHKQIV